jgi:hypothetical protein
LWRLRRGPSPHAANRGSEEAKLDRGYTAGPSGDKGASRHVGLPRAISRRRGLPRTLSDFYVEQFFELTPADVLAINERFHADRRLTRHCNSCSCAPRAVRGSTVCTRLRNTSERKLYVPNG